MTIPLHSILMSNFHEEVGMGFAVSFLALHRAQFYPKPSLCIAKGRQILLLNSFYESYLSLALKIYHGLASQGGTDLRKGSAAESHEQRECAQSAWTNPFPRGLKSQCRHSIWRELNREHRCFSVSRVGRTAPGPNPNS